MMIRKWLLSGILMIALLMVGLNNEDSEAVDPVSGECGSLETGLHATFSFNESTGIMTINGNGEMQNYKNTAERPWDSYKDAIKTVVITGVSSVGEYAFDGCSSLQSIILGDSVTEIKSFAFQHCESLTYVDLNKVETLQTQTFFDCKNLKDVVINESTKRINTHSFDECTSLESIIIPDSVTYLGQNVFDYSSLKRISVGNGLSSAVFSELNHSFNGPMYDTDGTTELKRDEVKGHVFLKIDDKLIKQETYRATFVVDGSNWKVLQYGVGEMIAAPVPTKDKQTFERWNPALPATMPAENLILNAVWSVNLIIKCVDGNGNQIAEDIVRNIECGSEYREEAPIIVGYVPEKQILEGKVDDKDLTIYLVYKRCYEVVLDPNNGNESSRYSIEQEKSVEKPADPVKEGFTFEGWFLYGTEYDFSEPVIDNITLVAKWTANQYAITILGEGVTVKNGETTIASGTTVDYDTVLTIIIADRTGYTGTVKVGDTVVDGTWPVKGDVTFVGTYTINQYTITIEGEGVTVKNGETTIASGDKVDHGTELTIAIAEKEGYTGTVKIGDTVVDGIWKVTEDITITGTYIENPDDSESGSDTMIIAGVVAVVIIVAITGFFIINRR